MLSHGQPRIRVSARDGTGLGLVTPGLGRILLKAGKAEIDQRMPCHMRTTCPHAEEARRRHFAREEDAVIGVDPGYKTTGLAEARRGRRAKRQRRRGQPPKEARFSNRRKDALRLPPSLRHLRDSILCWVRWLVDAYGGRVRAVVESAVFDPAPAQKPRRVGCRIPRGTALSQPPVPRALRARRAPVRLLREEEQGARVRPRRAEGARRERQLRQPSAGMPAMQPSEGRTERARVPSQKTETAGESPRQPQAAPAGRHRNERRQTTPRRRRTRAGHRRRRDDRRRHRRHPASTRPPALAASWDGGGEAPEKRERQRLSSRRRRHRPRAPSRAAEHTAEPRRHPGARRPTPAGKASRLRSRRGTRAPPGGHR